MILTVVTPSLNQARYLPETLASVRAAAALPGDAGEIEHLVMDGGSCDGTLEILQAQEFAHWSSAPDTGQAAAVNRGWRKARGEVVSFLCSDDLWLPSTAVDVLAAFAAQPAVDVVYGDYYFLEGETGWMRPRRAGPFSVERLFRHNFLSQPAVFVRRAVIDRHGGLREDLRFCMDHEYWLRIARATSWLYLEKPLAVMRLHADAKSSAQLGAAWRETARMARDYGQGWRFACKAIWMQVLGQHLYRARRKIYRAVGAARAARSNSGARA